MIISTLTFLLGLVAGFLIPRDAFPWMRRLSAWLMRERDNRVLAWRIMLLAAIAFVALVAMTGCARFGFGPRIATPSTTVQAPKDAGKPATVNESKASEAATIPPGSKVTITETAAIPATEKDPARPAVKTTEVIPSAPMQWQKTEAAVQASTGTVDTSIAQKRIEVAERRWLLFVAIGCAAAAVVLHSIMPAWPALWKGAGIGAALALAAWKFAELPAWLWLAAFAVFGALAMGYKRAEWDRDGDGIPDILEQRPRQ